VLEGSGPLYIQTTHYSARQKGQRVLDSRAANATM
jgi:hypothetical protein